MDFFRILKIIASRFVYLLLIPLVTGGIVFFITKNIPPKYSAFSTIYSGITSNNGIMVDAIRVDNAATQNEYNNVMSMLRSVVLYEEISLRLLTQHLMLEQPNHEVMSKEAFDELAFFAPEDVRQLVVKDSFEVTYQNLKSYIKQERTNYIYRLINYGHRNYSIQAISAVKGERLSNSDMIKISFVSTDPGICYNTVKFATEVIIEKYGELKVNQLNSAVKYFEDQLLISKIKLDAAEQRLLNYNIKHEVINYYEQTKQLTTQQEELELRLQNVKMEYESSIEVLEKIETEVSTRFNINLRNKEIMDIRDQLVYINNLIVSNEFDFTNIDESRLVELKRQKTILEDLFQNKVDSLNIFDNNSQGLEVQFILSQWFVAVKDNIRFTTQYKSISERLQEFMKQYSRFAPVGATIKRYEREIDVYEREYLSILQQLGLARQNEENVNLRSKMSIFETPKMPINPILSPYKLYSLAAAFFSTLFFLMAVFFIELLDKRIQSPSRLQKLSGLEVISGFPVQEDKYHINTAEVNQRAAMLITEKVKHLGVLSHKSFVIQFTENWNNTGKANVAILLARVLRDQGHEVTVLSLTGQAPDEQTEGHTEYLPDRVSRYTDYNQLLKDLSITTEYVICLVSPLSEGIVNPALLSSAQLNLMFFDAETFWSHADVFMINKVNKFTSDKSFAVLTNAIPDNLEELYGDIPKQRSVFRKAVKNFLKRIVKIS